MTEIEQLEAGIASFESQRGVLGDAVVDLALEPLRARLLMLRGGEPAGPDSPGNHRLKLATVIFADIVASTALVSRLDPEDVDEVMTGALRQFGGIIEAHRGTVLRYLGDGLIAVFGAESAREDDPECAVLAGLAILETAKSHARRIRERFGVEEFRVRVGANTGWVLLGAGVGADNTVLGATVHLAARMEQTAPPGGLRISRETYVHVRGLFEVERQSDLMLKGADAPVETYLVHAARPRSFDASNRGLAGVRADLVGRERELQVLRQTWQDVNHERRLRTLMIVAEAGVGKSRLVHEFGEHASVRAGAVFRGRAHPLTQLQPYALLRDVLAARFQIADSDPAETARDKLVAGVRALIELEGEAAAHLVGHLIGVDFSESPHVSGVLTHARHLRDAAFNAAERLLREVAERGRGPTVILLEDMHWADESSLEFIAYLLRRSLAVPLFIVMTTRPAFYECHPDWPPDKTSHERLDLVPLDPVQSDELARRLLDRVVERPDALLRLIIQGAEGNPYYMEEIIQMLMDDGVIEVEPGTGAWHVIAQKLGVARVPTTLAGVLQARLDALPPPEREALQQASVIGQTYWDEGVNALRPVEPDVFRSLVRKSLSRPREPSVIEGAGEFAFPHHLLHQVTYDTVLKALRRTYHALAARWLATRMGDRSGEHLAITAEHYERSGDREAAARYFARAANDAADRYANGAALAHISRALELIGADDTDTRWALLKQRRAIADITGDRTLQEETLDQLARIADDSADRIKQASVASDRAQLAERRGNFAAILTYAQQAVEWAEPSQSYAIAVLGHCQWAFALMRLGRTEEAAQRAEIGLELARRTGESLGEGQLLATAAGTANKDGDFVRAIELDLQALAVARAGKFRRLEAAVLNNLSSVYTSLGRFDEAEAMLTSAVALNRALGHRSGEASNHDLLALVYLMQGRINEALREAQAGAAIALEIGDAYLEAMTHMSVGDAHRGMNDTDSARTLYRFADERLRRAGLTEQAMQTTARLIDLAVDAGDLATGLEFADRVLKVIEQGQSIDAVAEPLEILLTCFRALRAAGDARATGVLEQLYSEVQTRASRIRDPQLREQMLASVPVNREIVSAWQNR